MPETLTDTIINPALDEIIAGATLQARDYQRRLVTKIHHNFKNIGVRSVLLESPTGSGKTAMGLLAGAMARKHDPDCGIAWVAMRRNLLAQVHRENARLGINLEGLTTVSMFDKHPPKFDADGRPIKKVIVDEAQHDAASSMASIHNAIRPEEVLGLTATPFRTDRMKLCFDKVLKDIGIHQLIQLDFLSQYHLYTVNEYNPVSVVETYLREPEKWGKSVMFWHRMEDAVKAVELLQAGGISARLVNGLQSDAEREAIIQEFEDGNIQVLCNLFILTEGFDSPSLKTVFVRDSQRGPTIQMAGRVFRKHPGCAFKQVVQSKNTHWPMVKTAHPAEEFTWVKECSEWRGYKLNPQINSIAVRCTLMAARRNVVLPDIIVQAHAGKRFKAQLSRPTSRRTSTRRRRRRG